MLLYWHIAEGREFVFLLAIWIVCLSANIKSFRQLVWGVLNFKSLDTNQPTAQRLHSQSLPCSLHVICHLFVCFHTTSITAGTSQWSSQCGSQFVSCFLIYTVSKALLAQCFKTHYQSSCSVIIYAKVNDKSILNISGEY